MVFSSHVFVFYFLPLALALYYMVPRRGQHIMLILLSYIFYGWANPLFVVLMFASTITDYVSGLVISGQRPGLGNSESIVLVPAAR
jgi:alginate O-acetyltransferase complex protein AlgI